MKKMLFVINPNAGQGTAGFPLMAVLQEFSAAGYRVEVYPTKGPGEVTKLIAKDGAQYDIIVSSGGDGTLNETTAGLMALPREMRPALGYIPRGTVNDVSRNLGLSRAPKQAAKDILEGKPFAMDVGSCNDRWFNYVAAFGIFTDVSYRTPQEEKQLLGRTAYLLDGVKRLSDIRTTKVKLVVEGEERQEEVLAGLVTSTTSVGGFRMATEETVDLSDGLFEVLLVRNLDSLQKLQNAAAGLLKRDFSGDSFYFCKASRVEFIFEEPVDWTVDGEHAGALERAVIENHCRAITIQVPKEKRKKHTGLLLQPPGEK